MGEQARTSSKAGDYFTASFGLTLSGGIAGKDLEGGFLFSNPSGTWGGDDQSSPLDKAEMQERLSKLAGLRITRSRPGPVVIRVSAGAFPTT